MHSEKDGTPTTIREQGHDEFWLHDLLVENPALMGLGDVTIEGQELHGLDGGNLDILAATEDTYYSVEVQLGEVDPSHSFRVFDYWARDRAHRKGKAHVAVLIVESAAGRYRPALQALAEYVPLIVIELRARVVDKELELTPCAVIANADLDITVVPAADDLADRTEEDWKSETDEDAWAAYEAVLEFVQELGRVRPEYRQRTYVSLRRGRRSWAVVSFAKGAIVLHLTDPDGVLGGWSPSDAFETFAPEAAAEGVPILWQAGLNAGKHPIAVRLRREDVQESIIRSLIQASWVWLDRDGEAFSNSIRPRGALSAYDYDWSDSFERYYDLENLEAGYTSRGGVVALVFHESPEDSRTIQAYEDADVNANSIAERVLTHHMQRRPTKKVLGRFVRSMMRDFDPGHGWSITSDEIAACLHEWG